MDKAFVTWNDSPVEVVGEDVSLKSLLQSHAALANQKKEEDPFFVCDLSNIVGKYNLWMDKLPRVEPFYAMKCYNDPLVLQILANLGTGFDCASKAEIQNILDLNVSPSRIVYAQTCKQRSHVEFAARHGVHLTTFDNEAELYKIKDLHPDATLLIRIIPPTESTASGQYSSKFGINQTHALQLLKIAKELKLKVIGVSFYVGSNCTDGEVFAAAVASARAVFNAAETAGFTFQLLDIGGGFPGQKSASSFSEIADVLSVALDKYFPPGSGVRIIAEPGRYFVATSFALAVNVISRRVVPRESSTNDNTLDSASLDGEATFMYYVNDGTHGTFDLTDQRMENLTAKVLHEHAHASLHSSILWGPTCSSTDCILTSCCLPELHLGDWIYFDDMGAYTFVKASSFNGMPRPRVHYAISKKDMKYMGDKGFTAGARS